MCSALSVLAQEITLSGVYRGRDIFVQNPYLNAEGSYCITSILVNGKQIIEAPATSAVKIDLTDFAIDAQVDIIVNHHTSCLPKILNPEVLNTGSGFQYLQVMADDASISWVTTGELPGDGKYILEKLKLDGWIPIDSVHGKGNLDNNQYSIGVDHYAGDNRFRLRYRYGGEDVLSEEFEFYSDLEPITYYPEGTVYDLISLSRPTDYVIKNYEGEVLLKGVGQDINVESLPYGELKLIIENTEETFFRPKPEIIVRPKKKKKGTKK
jgi:hypothetical protein